MNIEEIINSSESYDLEFKSAKGGFPGSFWETYSSFANTQGGQIFLGIKETPQGLRVDGLDKSTIEKYKKELWNNLNNRNKVSANILSLNDIKEIETNEGIVLGIRVPRAGLRIRPIYINGNPNKAYKREHEGDYECIEEEVRRMNAESCIMEFPMDARILDGFSIERDIDIESLRKYRQIFTNRQPTHPWSALNDVEFLKKLGGIQFDRRLNKEGLTLAGMLMFGKFSSITDPYCCPAYFPDYRESEPGTDKRWTDRICYDGTWETNLFNFYLKVYNKLVSSIPKPFALKNGVRIEDSPLHIAIREAFVNCLIHSDYTIDSNIIVLNEGTRYVFSNPGSLLVTIDQYRCGGESVCRNKSLQLMFMMIGASEKAGSGADKIWEGWKSSNYRNPFIELRDNKVVLELPFVSMLSTEVINKLKDIFGPEIIDIGHNKLLVLAACAGSEHVSNASLQKVLDLHPSDITALLKEMVEEKLLSASGLGKGTKYELNKKSNGASDIFANVTSPDSYTDTLFPLTEDYSEGNGTSDIPSFVTSSKTNIRTDKLYEAILEFCSEEFKSLVEISEGVGRSVRHLKRGPVPVLLQSGKLVRKYPDVPNHPNQQYKTVEGNDK